MLGGVKVGGWVEGGQTQGCPICGMTHEGGCMVPGLLTQIGLLTSTVGWQTPPEQSEVGQVVAIAKPRMRRVKRIFFIDYNPERKPSNL